jgi:glycosyltransferase involved in cell wall biosynthesis
MLKLKTIIDCEILKNQETGVEKYTKELIRHLDGKVDLELLHNSYVSHPLFSKYSTVCLKRKKFPFCRPFYALFLPPQISADILHAPTPVTPVWKKPKCKLIITIHDLTPLIFPQYHSWRRRIFFRFLLRYTIRIADAIIVDSQSTKKDVSTFLSIPENKINVVYLASDMKPQDDQLPPKYGINGDYFLYVGTVEPRKNLLRLIEAFNQLDRKMKLVIVGVSGWDNKAIYENKNPNLIFTGYVPEKDLPRFYCNAKLLVYPSFYEGFGIPILEAMNCGCPVITSNISSMPEIAGDAALLIDPYNVEEIKRAMQRLSSDAKLRKKLIENGYQQASKFSWEKTADETIKVYEKVLDT